MLLLFASLIWLRVALAAWYWIRPHARRRCPRIQRCPRICPPGNIAHFLLPRSRLKQSTQRCSRVHSICRRRTAYQHKKTCTVLRHAYAMRNGNATGDGTTRRHCWMKIEFRVTFTTEAKPILQEEILHHGSQARRIRGKLNLVTVGRDSSFRDSSFPS